MAMALLKKFFVPFLNFEETSRLVKLLFLLCDERSCNANFKMGSAVSVHRQKVEKIEFDRIKKEKSSFGDDWV